MSKFATSSRNLFKGLGFTLALAAVLGLGLRVGLERYANAHSAQYVTAARRYIAAGQDDKALMAVDHVSGATAAVARSQAYLEEGNGALAVVALDNVSGTGVASQRTLCQSVQSVAPDGALALGQTLYAKQLYLTAKRVTAKAPDSSSKYELLADATLKKQPLTTDDLSAAQAAAEKGSALYPANLQLHQTLEYIDTQLHDSNGAAAQAELIRQLRSGAI